MSSSRRTVTVVTDHVEQDRPPPPQTDPPSRPGPRSPVAWALRDVLRADAAATRALADRLGLGVNDVLALQHLAGRPLGPADLAHRLGMRTASVTLLLDRLERAGHIQRKPHATDHRRKVVSMTPQAQLAVLEALTPLTAAIDKAASALSPTEAAAATHFLHRAADLLNRYATGA